jgi:Smg protein
MFEVLAFVYENYNAVEGCPEPLHLQRKLNAVGFEADEIDDAIVWLQGLNIAAHCTAAKASCEIEAVVSPIGNSWLHQPLATSVRIFPLYEQIHLGPQCLGFIRFLESANVLPGHLREVVIDRAMAAPGGPVALEDLKLIILMVFWRFELEPDALILDELCDDVSERVAH